MDVLRPETGQNRLLTPHAIKNTLAMATVAIFGMSGEMAANPGSANAQEQEAFVCPPGQHDVHTVDAEGNVTDYCVDDEPQGGQPEEPSRSHHKEPHSKDPRDFYKNPLRKIHHLIPRRIDMGVDYSGYGKVKALGEGVVTVAKRGTSRYWGNELGNAVVYRLTEGPARGKSVFVSENCLPRVHVGQRVTAHSTVCYMRDFRPNIEMGWAQGGRSDKPVASRYYNEGDKTAHGANFNRLIVKLGGPRGNSHPPYLSNNPDQIVGRIGKSYPDWL